MPRTEESEDEAPPRAMLFGAREKGQDMSLDGIDTRDLPLSSSQQTMVGEPKVSILTQGKSIKLKVPAPRRPRAEHEEMSLDDIRATDIGSDNDEPSSSQSSQATLVDEPLRTRSRLTRGKVSVEVTRFSSQVTLVNEERPRPNLRTVSAREKKVPTGGIVKTKKKRLAVKNPISMMGSGSALDPITIDA